MQRGAGSKGTGSAGFSAAAAAAAGGDGSGWRGVGSGVGGYDMMSEDEQPKDAASAADAALKGGTIKRTRVEGRGSSAAQRAAASEACKSISLERLQAQYHRPLSEVARDLKVSVARLLKKCREFGILRWPYRHVRSVQESIDQLEKDRQAATDEATDDMELRLRLLRRRGELVAHFASCWLESDMRKGIFLADPRDVDSMLAIAHEAHGRRRIPPPGWETLGRFPEMAVREHFLEQMRTYMIGGGTSMSPDSDSPHRAGQQHSLDTSSSSVEDTRERMRQQQLLQQQQQQQQQQQAYGDGGLQAPWQHQRHQQYPNALPPWQGGSPHLYGGAGGGGGGVADQNNLAHPNQFWGSGSAAAPAPMPAGTGGILAAGDYGRLRAPAHGGEYHHPLAGAQAPSSLGYSSGPWASGQPSAAASSATLRGGHRQSGGDNTGSSAGGGGAGAGAGAGGYFLGPAGTHGVRGGDQREGQLGGNVWGHGGGGSGASSRDSVAGGGDGGGARDMWRPPERQTPPPAAAQRGWVAADLANPPRSDFPPGVGGGGGGGGGGGAAGGALPSIFQMSQQRVSDRPLSSFSGSGSAGASGVAGGGLRGAIGGGSDASGGAGWGGGGGFPQDQALLGGFDNRWGGAPVVSAQLQQHQHQELGHMVSNARWQDPAGGGGGGGGEDGRESAMDADIPRAGSFDHPYGGPSPQGRHRGTEGGGGPEGQA